MMMALTSCISTSRLEAIPVKISSAMPNEVQDNPIAKSYCILQIRFPSTGISRVVCCLLYPNRRSDPHLRRCPTPFSVLRSV
ncbi:hypothetical protein BDW75DRAFT_211955 [Aspergillus navahoensis]